MTKWKLLAKYIFDKPDKAEKEKVVKWIQKNPRNEMLLKDLTHLKTMKKTDSHIDTDKAWNNLKSRIDESEIPEKEPISIVPKQILKYAAIVLIFFGIGSAALFSYEKIFNSNDLVSEENFQPMENKKVTFPDGSTAYLNSSTLINYPNTFEKTDRLINIKGEAFFDVKSNPSKPFVVKAEKAKIEVLGTSFNVRANGEDNKVEVFVKSGKVKLSQVNKKQNFVILEPGYVGVISQNGIKKMKNNNQNYLSWITKRVYFKNTDLQKVTQTLEKTYNVDIIIEESISSDSLSLTANFDNESIDYILDVISRTFNIQSKQKNENQFLLTN